MLRKEFADVFKQLLSFLFILAIIIPGVVYLVPGIGDMKSNRIDVMIAIIETLLPFFILFLGFSAFANESKQKGMEYLMTMPISRNRILFNKLIPRVCVILCMMAAILPLATARHTLIELQGIIKIMPLIFIAAFILFFISFSLCASSNDYISLFLNVILCVLFYLLTAWFILILPLYVRYGYSLWFTEWQKHWNLLLSKEYMIQIPMIAIIMILLVIPFIGSFWLTFVKCDFKPSNTFNNKQSKYFILLFLAFFLLSLFPGYIAYQRIINRRNLYLTQQNKLILMDTNTLYIFGTLSMKKIKLAENISNISIFAEDTQSLYLSVRFKDVEEIAKLNKFNFAYSVLFKMNEPYWSNSYYYNHCTGYLNLLLKKYDYAINDDRNMIKNDDYNAIAIAIDTATAKIKKYSFKNDMILSSYYIADDEIDGKHFWLLRCFGVRDYKQIIGIWEDGQIEPMDISGFYFQYLNHTLFAHDKCGYHLYQISDTGAKLIRTIDSIFFFQHEGSISNCRTSNDIYVTSCERKFLERQECDEHKNIALLNLKSFEIQNICPQKGNLYYTDSDSVYYVEPESIEFSEDDWRRIYPEIKKEKTEFQKQQEIMQYFWIEKQCKKIYRLEGTKKQFIKQICPDSGYGFAFQNNGIITIQNNKFHVYALPDLRELHFKMLDWTTFSGS